MTIFTALKVVDIGDFFSGTDDVIHEFCGNATNFETAKDLVIHRMKRTMKQDIRYMHEAAIGKYTVDDYAVFVDDKDEDVGLTVLILKRREGYDSLELERYKIYTAPVFEASTEASLHD
jgi:hypothetical protein